MVCFTSGLLICCCIPTGSGQPMSETLHFSVATSDLLEISDDAASQQGKPGVGSFIV